MLLAQESVTVRSVCQASNSAPVSKVTYSQSDNAACASVERVGWGWPTSVR